jgi:hypothetical protein
MKERLLVAVLACVSLPALAQEPAPSEVFFAPSYLNADEQSLYGGAIAYARYFNRSFGVVVDASLHFGSSEGTDLRELNLLAGPRFAFNRGGSARPFFQALFGLRRDTGSVRILDVTLLESKSRFGMAFAAGVDVRLSPRWALRLQGDYLYGKSEGETADGFRVSAGTVYQLGAGPTKQP